MATPTTRFCTSADGTRIAYGMWGEGPPLLFVPAWPHALSHWLTPQTWSWTEKMASDHTFVVIDRRGCGASQRNIEGFSVETHVEDIEAVVTHSGVGRLALYAVCDGAAMALVFAARHPDLVGRLALWCPLAAPEHSGGQEALSGVIALMRQNWPLGIRTFAELVMPSLSAEEQHWYRGELRGLAPPELWAHHYSFLAALDVCDELPKVSAPVLVVQPNRVVGVSRDSGRSIATRLPDARLVTLEGDCIHHSFGDLSHVELVHDFFAEEEGARGPARPSAELLAVLCTDLESHTQMMDRLGDTAGRAILREHEKMTRETLEEYGGHEFKTAGDSFLAWFTSAQRALACGVALQRRFGESKMPEGVRLRVGVDAGEPIPEDNDFFGHTVIVASRVCGQAQGGEVLVADVVRQLAAGKGFRFEDRGESTLKGFSEPTRIWSVEWRETPKQVLDIELDEARKAAQLESITGSEYFRELREQAEGLRGFVSGRD